MAAKGYLVDAPWFLNSNVWVLGLENYKRCNSMEFLVKLQCIVSSVLTRLSLAVFLEFGQNRDDVIEEYLWIWDGQRKLDLEKI